MLRGELTGPGSPSPQYWHRSFLSLTGSSIRPGQNRNRILPYMHESVRKNEHADGQGRNGSGDSPRSPGLHVFAGSGAAVRVSLLNAGFVAASPGPGPHFVSNPRASCRVFSRSTLSGSHGCRKSSRPRVKPLIRSGVIPTQYSNLQALPGTGEGQPGFGEKGGIYAILFPFQESDAASRSGWMV